MKTVKRIIAVVILCVVVLLVGYSCYTGSRLTSYPQNLDGCKNRTFFTNDGGMVATNAEEFEIEGYTLEFYGRCKTCKDGQIS